MQAVFPACVCPGILCLPPASQPHPPTQDHHSCRTQVTEWQYMPRQSASGTQYMCQMCDKGGNVWTLIIAGSGRASHGSSNRQTASLHASSLSAMCRICSLTWSQALCQLIRWRSAGLWHDRSSSALLGVICMDKLDITHARHGMMRTSAHANGPRSTQVKHDSMQHTCCSGEHVTLSWTSL